ncbi:MAG: winged helix-turn-helix domain-containing protein [Planctomycetaceae bacterium]|nr:response regulator transcription factor [Planctomycetaceae bacterium]
MSISEFADAEIRRKKSSEQLLRFQWEIEQFCFTDNILNELEKYLLHARDTKYGRELSDHEEDCERTRWIGRQAVQLNWDSFRQLLHAANTFVLSLADTHFILALGELANLDSASEFGRSSPEIPFQPISLPNPTPINLSKYEAASGGPHVLGGRLLWWCAAALTPEKFGYSVDLTNDLASQPFWFTCKSNMECFANNRPMELLSITVQRILTAKQARIYNAPTTFEQQEADGPLSGCRFKYRDRVVTLTPRSSQIMELLWRKKPRPITRTDLIDDVWEKEVKDKTVDGEIKRLRDQLSEAGIGLNELEIITKNSTYRLEEKA